MNYKLIPLHLLWSVIIHGLLFICYDKVFYYRQKWIIQGNLRHPCWTSYSLIRFFVPNLGLSQIMNTIMSWMNLHRKKSTHFFSNEYNIEWIKTASLWAWIFTWGSMCLGFFLLLQPPYYQHITIIFFLFSLISTLLIFLIFLS